MKQPVYYVGIDVGGSTIKGGVVDDNGKPLSGVSLPTEAARGQDHGLRQMAEAVRQAVSTAGLKLEQVSAIGVATPGTMDIPGGYDSRSAQSETLAECSGSPVHPRNLSSAHCFSERRQRRRLSRILGR